MKAQSDVDHACNSAGLLSGESYTGGPSGGLTASNRFNEPLHRTNVAILGVRVIAFCRVRHHHPWGG